MKKSQIEVGSYYIAKVAGEDIVVQVKRIRRVNTPRSASHPHGRTTTVYDVINLDTLETILFHNASRFCYLAVKPADPAKSFTITDVVADNARLVKFSTAAHLIIKARAGTGKTTTLIEGLRRIRGLSSAFIPSPQQATIWKAMKQDEEVETICFVAFNKSIATELQKRVPEDCKAMTMHSMGFQSVTNNFGRVKVNSYRVQDIISEILECDIRELRRVKPVVIKATEKLVGLCKMNLVGSNGEDHTAKEQWNERLAGLAAYYDVELNSSQYKTFKLVPRVLERCKDVERDGCIDFNDMIWLPVILNLPVCRYDLLLIDEAQDLNRCQQQLALKSGRRLILCGDEKQAIYGFAGADSKSMSYMAEILAGTSQGVKVLPLTVTRRCGRAIVKEAQKIVPDFEAHDVCSDGKLSCLKYGEHHDYMQPGDMILCRVNAPLVSECFRLLKAGIKATIQGRDIAQGLISTVRKMKAINVSHLLEKLSDWLHDETQRENSKRIPNENKLIALQDRYDCLCCFCEGHSTVDAMIGQIENVFSDEHNGVGIKLSSIHRAKGLEADRVFILQIEGATCPHPMAKSAWQQEQEYNLLYVAITRAKEELVYVS